MLSSDSESCIRSMLVEYLTPSSYRLSFAHRFILVICFVSDTRKICVMSLCYHRVEVKTDMLSSRPVRGGQARKPGPIMAVPKPINLPSRKAENNGFDPSTQLVPSTLGGWSAGSKAAPPGAAPNTGTASGSASNSTPRSALAAAAAAADTGDTILAPKAPWSTGQPAATSVPAAALSSQDGSAADFPRLGVPPSPTGSRAPQADICCGAATTCASAPKR